MHRILPLFIVLWGLYIGFHSVSLFGVFAHLNFEHLCQEGVGLSNVHTPTISVDRFRDYCGRMSNIFVDGSGTSYTAGILGLLTSVLLIVIGINFRVISKWYSKYI